MKKTIYLLFITLTFFLWSNQSLAKSVYCTYGTGVSVIVGIDEEGALVKQKNDQNPVIYDFGSVSSGFFITDNANYYCPEQIYYTLEPNAESRRNDYRFSFEKNTSSITLELVDQEIDNNVSEEDPQKIIDHACTYGQTSKYIINYYTDGTIGPNDTSYSISNDFPTTGACLEEVYLCQGSIIYKTPSWDNNNCTKISRSDISSNPYDDIDDPLDDNIGGYEDDKDYTANDCDSILGNPKTSGTPAYYLQFAFNVMKYIAIVLLFVLTIVDFTKAIASNNQDEIKKCTQKALKRLIITVIIFLLPIIIRFILTILGVYSPGTCGIK